MSEIITVDPAVGQEYRLDNLLVSPSAIFSIALLPIISIFIQNGEKRIK